MASATACLREISIITAAPRGSIVSPTIQIVKGILELHTVMQSCRLVQIAPWRNAIIVSRAPALAVHYPETRVAPLERAVWVLVATGAGEALSNAAPDHLLDLYVSLFPTVKLVCVMEANASVTPVSKRNRTQQWLMSKYSDLTMTFSISFIYRSQL